MEIKSIVSIPYRKDNSGRFCLAIAIMHHILRFVKSDFMNLYNIFRYPNARRPLLTA